MNYTLNTRRLSASFFFIFFLFSIISAQVSENREVFISKGVSEPIEGLQLEEIEAPLEGYSILLDEKTTLFHLEKLKLLEPFGDVFIKKTEGALTACLGLFQTFEQAEETLKIIRSKGVPEATINIEKRESQRFKPIFPVNSSATDRKTVKEYVSPLYDTTIHQIEVAPASQQWIKRRSDENCVDDDPENCIVWCLVEVPAQYRDSIELAKIGCPEGYQEDGERCCREIEVPDAIASTSSTTSSPFAYHPLPKTVEGYYIQLGAFSVVENAERLFKKLWEGGFHSLHVTQESIHGSEKTLNKVMVAPFRSKEEAWRYYKKINIALDLKGFVEKF